MINLWFVADSVCVFNFYIISSELFHPVILLIHMHLCCFSIQQMRSNLRLHLLNRKKKGRKSTLLLKRSVCLFSVTCDYLFYIFNFTYFYSGRIFFVKSWNQNRNTRWAETNACWWLGSDNKTKASRLTVVNWILSIFLILLLLLKWVFYSSKKMISE